MTEYKRDFKTWHLKKSKIDAKDRKQVYFYEREIWWIAVGHNVGFEQDGKSKNFARPVLIVRKFNQYLFWGLPLTTTKKQGKYYLPTKYRDDTDSVAILSQLRAFDAKRLIDKDGVLDEETFSIVQHNLADILTNKPQK